MRILIVCAALALGGCYLFGVESPSVENRKEADFPFVRVNVRGTPFERAPDSVTLLVDSLEKRYSKKPNRLDAHGVGLFEEAGTLYCVQMVATYNKNNGTAFVDGDTIYVYTCDSILAEAQLLGNHGFRRLNALDEYYGLFQIRPHVFAQIGTDRDTAHFTCAMHPKVAIAQEGNCPICCMDLMPLKVAK